MPPAQPFLSTATPRPNQDHDHALSRTLGEQPDTPVRHRPWLEGASRHRALRLVQILIVFLLVVAAGSWLFVQTDYSLAQRPHSRSAKTRYMLPDGSLISDRRTFEQISRNARKHGIKEQPLSHNLEGSLFQGKEFGLDPYSDDYESNIMRNRWIDIVRPASAQTVIFDPPFINKSTSIVVLTPRCCEDNAMTEDDMLLCYRNIMDACPSLAPSECFLRAAKKPPCRLPLHSRSFRLSYLTAIQRLVPYLEELGWTNIQVHRSFLDEDSSLAGSPDNSTCDRRDSKEAAVAAIKAADIVIADVALLNGLFSQFPHAQFVVVETGETAGVLPKIVHTTNVVEHARVLSIWRSQVLEPADLQNGPLLAGRAHLAYLPGASRLNSFRSRRNPSLMSNTLARLRPLLSHAFRFRYPLECGGSLEHLRFVGAFLQDFSQWHPPRHAQRSIDVAFVGKADFSAQWPKRRAEANLVTKHRQGLREVLQKMQRRHPYYSIKSSTEPFEHYNEYLAFLQDVKIVVSPYGAAEWSHSDLEAVLCGCLLIKVNPASYVAFPDVFRVTKHVLRASPDWNGLEDTLLSALQDKVHTQRMADRAAAIFLEYSDMRRYAGEVDDNLSVLVRWWLQKVD